MLMLILTLTLGFLSHGVYVKE